MDGVDTAASIDPEIAAILEQAAAGGAPRTPELTPAEARERVRSARLIAHGKPEMRAVEDLAIPGPAGDLRCRLYRPTTAADLLIVFLHGGGWVLGDLDTADGSSRRLAATAAADVLTVDYRLAPEHPFPAAVEDADAAMRWAGAQLARGRPLVAAGDSAGANLAIVAGLRGARRGHPVDAQLLAYPVVDCDLDRPAYLGVADILPLRRAELSWYWDHYLPDPARRLDPEATPLHAALAGAPASVLVQAGNDPLVEEGAEFAAALERADVPLRRLLFPGAVHGFLAMPGELALRDRALTEACAALRDLLGRGGDGLATPEQRRNA